MRVNGGLFIRLLTGSDLIVEGGEPINWKGRNARALFAILALHPGRAMSRERLAGLLWSEADGSTARNNLRMALLAMRRAIEPVAPDLIHATNETITLSLEPVRTDVGLFEFLASRPDASARRKALDLYRGELLGGIPLPANAAELDDLLRAERERLRSVAIEVGTNLLESMAAPGHEADARSVANVMLEIDPANEIAHRTLIGVLINRGERAAAIRQFEHCITSVREIYGASPSRETLSLGARLRRESTSTERDETKETPKLWDIDEILRLLNVEVTSLGGTTRRARHVRLALATLAGAALVWLGAETFGWLFREKPVQASIRIVMTHFEPVLPDCAVPDIVDEVRLGMERALVSVPGVTVVLPNIDSGTDATGTFLLTADLQCVGEDFRISIALKRPRSSATEWMSRYGGHTDTLAALPEDFKRDLVRFLSAPH